MGVEVTKQVELVPLLSEELEHSVSEGLATSASEVLGEVADRSKRTTEGWLRKMEGENVWSGARGLEGVLQQELPFGERSPVLLCATEASETLVCALVTCTRRGMNGEQEV